ncbi:707_t:CDS:2 [Funneliformis mosseae]|uniref:707_t:CDS:1 n=1 Tax=Funneliformis mosseae TaxID=27381 RepID=A0A9N9G079_FUNMO|nr:707_t:CDS:2 [Funneliformis mosseae]
MTSPYDSIDPEVLGLISQNYQTSCPDVQQLFFKALSSCNSQGTVVAYKHSFFHLILVNLFKITCEEILDKFEPMTSNTVTDKVFLFTYNQINYKITCEYVPSPMVVDILNKKVYDVDTNFNEQQQRPFVDFPKGYKVDFESSLKPYLDVYLAQVHIQNDQSGNENDEYFIEAKEDETYPCKWTKEITEEFIRILKNKIQELVRTGSISKNISKKHWEIDINSKCQYKKSVQEILEIIDSGQKNK